MREDFEEFVQNFNIVDNSIKQRTLIRWNGRDLRNRENLAEHTHLVVACAIELVHTFRNYGIDITAGDFEQIIHLSMIHDSLELLRGDILSITKDTIEGLRSAIDEEELEFQDRIYGVKEFDRIVKQIVRLADLKACYKFVETELRYPNNDFAKSVYITTKKKFDDAYEQVLSEYGYIPMPDTYYGSIYKKGYADDAGVDIILRKAEVFLPLSTTVVQLEAKYTPNENEMGFLCARTSAAAKGLNVAMCPIDPHYDGNIVAIVHNVSNDIVSYAAGESFCQLVLVPMICIKSVEVKKPGKRSDSRMGGTDR